MPKPKVERLREPVLIVGTGRCGSTALSEVVATQPRWLSLSEVFSSMVPDIFPPGAIDGPRFEALLCEPRRDMGVILANHLEPSEFLYPIDGGLGRYTRETGIPPLAMVCLPHLTGLGDDLLDELRAEVRGWSPAPAGEHYRRLFDLLARRFGAERWIERSGGSLAYLGPLLEAFPEAKVVHVWRDGPDCSASMAKHGTFRLALVRREMVRLFAVDPFESAERPASLLESEYGALVPEAFDGEVFRRLDLPLAKFAGMWSSQLLLGLGLLAGLPREQVLHIHFEELLAQPEAHVRSLARFIDGEADEAWVASAAKLIRPGRRTPGPARLDERTRRICEGGRALLREAGVPGA
ncbi:MAG: sulfotransferase [Holophagaceae bacterium]|nr:sulfotransferase [Holophagaceae bacterium]